MTNFFIFVFLFRLKTEGFRRENFVQKRDFETNLQLHLF